MPGRLAFFAFTLLALLAAVVPPGFAVEGTELGSEDDLTVLGVDGTFTDPDVELKGFTVFGSTQTSYTGAVAGPGNVVVNGILAVSSGAYFVGNSTFTGAGKIFVNDGAPGQVLRKNAAGYLDWDSVTALGDNLGNHTATQALNMNGKAVVGVSSLTVMAPDTLASSLWVSTSAHTPHLYVSTGGHVGIGAIPSAGYKFTVFGADALVNNVRVGQGPNPNATVSNGNLVFGNNAGAVLAAGSYRNYLIGYGAGSSITTGGDNVIIANATAASGTMNSVVVGSNAGANPSSAVIIGNLAGQGLSADGVNSVLVGYGAGRLGAGANGAVAVGYQALFNNAGARNIAIGYSAGSGITSGQGNIVIGDTQDVQAPASSSQMNIGGVLFGDLAAKTIGISTRVPQAALDVVSTGTAANIYAQIWRDGGGVIKASMTSQGKLYADVSAASGIGDNLGDHTATQVLQLGAYGVNSSSSITAARYQINGSTMLVILPGVESIAVGPNIAARNTGNYNVFVGSGAAAANTTGAQGTFIGHSAGYTNTTGAQNTFVGYASGYKNLGGWYNTFLGVNAGYNNVSGQYNTFLGDGAGLANTTGSNNAYLGYYAGSNGQTGGGNIVIGYDQGLSAAAANNELNLGGVLYGDLAAKTIGISTRVPQAALDVVSTGTAANQMAQLWRASDGVIKASMSATGVMMATKFIGDGSGLGGMTAAGDNLGNHIATMTLTANYGIAASSMILNAAGVTGSNAIFRVAGSTMVVLNNGDVGIGTTAPGYALDIYRGADKAMVNLQGAGDTWNYSGFNLWSDEATDKYWSLSHRKAAGEENSLLLEEYDGTAYKQRMVLAPHGTVSFNNPGTKTQLELQGAGDTYNYTSFVFWNNDWTKYWAMMHRKGAGETNTFRIEEYDGVTYAPQLSIIPGGNVGIGTTAPGQKLYVSGGKIGLDGGQQIIFSDADTTNNLKLQLYSGYGLGINGGTLFYAANGNHSWRDTGGTNERMLLTTAANGGLTVKGTGNSSFAGNVGIGTTGPTHKLHVAGGILATSSITAQAGFYGAGSGLTSLNPANISAGTAGISISGNAATVTNGVYTNVAGDYNIASNTNGNTGYGAASIELRESNFGGATATPPRLAFHWGGAVASQITIESSARLAVRNNPGTGYERLAVATPVDGQDAATKAYVDAAAGMRKFYLTTTLHYPDEARTACAAGYHMASFWEVLNLSDLKYDTSLGYTTADSGGGPPAGAGAGGWVRTGSTSNGTGNCYAYTSKAAGIQGTSVYIVDPVDWTNGVIVTNEPRWYVSKAACPNQLKVWCVAD